MKNIRKQAAGLMLAALSLGLLSSCSKETTDTEIKKSKEEVKVDPEQNIFAAELDDYKGDGNTLIVHSIASNSEDWPQVEEQLNKYLTEHMNTKVQYQFHGWGDYPNNMNTIINSGEYFDIAFGSSITGYKKFAQEGSFADVKKLLPAAPNLKALIPDSVWQGMTLSDGRIFGVPAYKDSSATQYFTFDKAFVDKYKFDYQNCHDFKDLEPLLKEAKEAEPNTYPLTMNQAGFFNVNWDYEFFGGGVGVKFGTTDVVSIYSQEEVKDRYRLFNKWYKAGYINPEANTLTVIEDSERMIHAQPGYPGADTVWTSIHGSPIVSTPRSFPYYTTATIQGSFMVISEASKYKQDAIKVLERMNVDTYVRNLLAYGIEGVHYNFVDGSDKVIQRIDEAKNYSVPAYAQGQFMNLYVEYPNPEDQWLKVHEQNKTAKSSPLLGFMFDPTNVQTEISALENTISKYGTSLRTGEGDVEQLLAAQEEEMKQIGIDKVIEEAQKQVDEFVKNKG